ncbi:hypothetical protein JQ633_28950 [Bradyrhizobium tropiciagri]|uniref:hypothetical protein n=1 Tax=Bradyrhizobium tropiciagri TaxID=312253 RepID=UPI001BAC171B|nr:hypothetical protein [Bradyrhizobium tropiciagri]MBR0874415.1 hypothetical protein [Bradyrhizobium tropiciagri]
MKPLKAFEYIRADRQMFAHHLHAYEGNAINLLSHEIKICRILLPAATCRHSIDSNGRMMFGISIARIFPCFLDKAMHGTVTDRQIGDIFRQAVEARHRVWHKLHITRKTS